MKPPRHPTTPRFRTLQLSCNWGIMKAFTVSTLLLAVALALYTEPVQAQGPTDRVNLAAQVSMHSGVHAREI